MTSAGLPAVLHDWVLDGRLPRPADEDEADRWTSAAAAQGLAGLLATAVRASRQWPPQAAARLHNIHAWAVRQAVCQGDAARQVRDLLARGGMRTLPLKGAALNTRLYDSPAERPMVDVDLLVLDRWPEALAAVESAGWCAVDEGDHAVAFEDARTGVMVELHRSLTSCPGFFPVDGEGMWDRSAPTPDGDRLPSGEDLLVHVSLHAAFQHGFAVSLVQLLDVRRLLERLPLDMASLAVITRAARAAFAVGATLRVARDLVGAPVSAELHAMFVDGLPGGLSRWLAPRVASGAVLRQTPAALTRARWELAAGRRLELVRRTFSPASARLQDRAGFVATALRAARIVRRWGIPIVAAGGAPKSLTRHV